MTYKGYRILEDKILSPRGNIVYPVKGLYYMFGKAQTLQEITEMARPATADVEIEKKIAHDGIHPAHKAKMDEGAREEQKEIVQELKSGRLELRLDPQTRENLKKLAENNNRSMADTIRLLVQYATNLKLKL